MQNQNEGERHGQQNADQDKKEKKGSSKLLTSTKYQTDKDIHSKKIVL